jgi:Putative zinc-finger
MDDKQHLSRSTCPTDLLEWYANHTLSPEEQVTVQVHLAQCSDCQAEVDAWARLRQTMQVVSTHTPAPRADLFSRIEQQLDLVSPPILWRWGSSLTHACCFMLTISAEHVWAQARLIRRDLFWLPLFLIPLVGSIVFLPQPWQQSPGTIALMASLLAAFSIAFLYGQDADPAREIVLVTQTSPQVVLGIRCGLVFGYDLVFNCGLVLPFLAWHGIITPAWFLTNWLAPLCCLSAIALLLSILMNASAAALACGILWLLRGLNDLQTTIFGDKGPLPKTFWQQHYENFWHQGPLLFGVATLAVLLAFMAIERKERFAR